MSTDLAFTTVPVRARHDGWTRARQFAFVAALRALGNVAAACRAVGMSWQTAYRLRARADATGFTAAWDAALAPDLSQPVSGRAVDGIVTPIFYRGKRIGERRRYDNRLAIYLLKLRCPGQYGADITSPAADPDDVPPVRAAPAAGATRTAHPARSPRRRSAYILTFRAFVCAIGRAN